jgi:serine/threonine-protein kinase
MGEVYRARDLELGRQVAVKVLPPQLAGDAERVARFHREARAVAALQHASILSLHDFGTADGICYAVTELLEGETLRERIERSPLPWRRAAGIAAAVAEGLAAAHARGIVHRDVKPENLFVLRDGRVKILDFGLACQTLPASPEAETTSLPAIKTEAGTVLGTCGYMSPEQARGLSVGARSDIFSLGCVLHEMVTGKAAFMRSTMADTLAAVLNEEAPDPTLSGRDVPIGLTRVIRRCLEKQPEARFESAHDLAFALSALVSDPGPARAVEVRPSPRLPRAAWLGIAVLLAGLAGIAIYVAFPRRSAIGSVAILPFVNESGDPRTDYLGDGIPEGIINSLSQLRRHPLKVRPFTSVTRLRGPDLDVQEAAKRLGVEALVTGKVVQREQGLSIQVALVDVSEESQVWGQRYDRKLSDILAVQDDLTRDIAAQLRLRLTGEDERLALRRPTEDVEAYLLYQEGTYHWSKLSEERIRVAIDCFQRALTRDPRFAWAHLGLARCYMVLAANYSDPNEVVPKWREAIEGARRLDASLPELHGMQGSMLLFYDWQLPAAEKELQLAREATPDGAHGLSAYYQIALGRLEAAIAEQEKAHAIDPLEAVVISDLGQFCMWAGKYDRAIAASRRALELDPAFPFAHANLVLTHALRGSHDEALAAIDRASEAARHNPPVLAWIGCAQALLGRADEARSVIVELRQMASRRYVLPYLFAEIHAALGEKDEAFAWLEKGIAARDPWMIFLKVDPVLESLRTDPRFAGLVRRVGLPG